MECDACGEHIFGRSSSGATNYVYELEIGVGISNESSKLVQTRISYAFNVPMYI